MASIANIEKEMLEGGLFRGLKMLLDAEEHVPPDEWLNMAHDCAAALLYSRRSPPLAYELAAELVRRDPGSDAFKALQADSLDVLRGVAKVEEHVSPRLIELVRGVAHGNSLTDSERREVLALLAR